MAEVILGISAYFHDSAAVLLVDGKLVAAAQEERFTRIKNDAAFPVQAVHYVLNQAEITLEDVTAIAYFEKPLLKFERLLETYHAFAPNGLKSFLKAMPIWLKEKLFIRKSIAKALHPLRNKKIPIYFPEHHLSHAASAFFPSPYKEAAILTLDGVGEWLTLSISHGKGNAITVLSEQHFPHSLGLLYSAFTYYLGFAVNSGEYKVMGLAAYGESDSKAVRAFVKRIKLRLVDIREDGSFLLNMAYFKFATHLHMTHDPRWEGLFGMKRRLAEDPLEQIHADLAKAIQLVTEEIVSTLAKTAISLTGCSNLVMAGGVALNSVANGKLTGLPEIENLWVQPAAGDAGGALGAAYAVWHIAMGKSRLTKKSGDAMRGALLGPSFTNDQILSAATTFEGLNPVFYPDEKELLQETIQHLADGKVVGWFQGRMEFGPRALGNRSILGDPRNPDMQQRINRRIKFRESFRPFAPSVIEEDATTYFELEKPSPYMLLVKPVAKNIRITRENIDEKNMRERLDQMRSSIPSVTHVDFSARIQTVDKNTNPRYRKLLEAFKVKTGMGILINTSFNIKDEPIVRSPKDAIKCFLNTEMDVLVIGGFILKK